MRWLLLLVAAGALYAAPKATPADFDRLVDRYFDDYFHYNPTAGTSAGFHQYDSQLEDYALATIAAEIRALRHFLTEFEQFPAAVLSPEEAADRELVIRNIESQLLELETIRMWEKNPDTYSSGMTSSAYVIISRTFAPAAERLRSLIERERRMTTVLGEARRNLRNPPRIYTEVALEQLPGNIAFFKNDVPAAFKTVSDTGLLAEFHDANQAVISGLEDYQKFLKNNLLARSKGDFRIGAANYAKKLSYDEMVDTPVDQLLEIGFRNLHENQEAFRKTAAKIDPKRTPQEILQELEKDHPAPDQLLQTFRDALGGMRRFVIEHKIATIPSTVEPIVEETPPFMRALTTASMDTPGPFEKVAKEAFFNVTLPEPGWSRERSEELMEDFNRGTIVSTGVHEVYPGHYVQFLWVKQAPSKVRKLIGAGTNAEGWAHYCEQMMLDEGYGNGDPKLRLGQLQDALLRNARYIVGIEMHTGKMTFDQAVDFFVKEGHQTHAVAELETKRGTSDPTYLVYTLGKLEILKLREDYRKQRGATFTLLDFHDAFLRQGFPPIKIVRRALLGNDSPVL
ncbi:MAG TPA: DUF885 domain-containing protein [Bryobacteraceae bacterium]|nr:DUF885 domain-containing protein [Bryobacteraceae bacterium]